MIIIFHDNGTFEIVKSMCVKFCHFNENSSIAKLLKLLLLLLLLLLSLSSGVFMTLV